MVPEVSDGVHFKASKHMQALCIPLPLQSFQVALNANRQPVARRVRKVPCAAKCAEMCRTILHEAGGGPEDSRAASGIA